MHCGSGQDLPLLRRPLLSQCCQPTAGHANTNACCCGRQHWCRHDNRFSTAADMCPSIQSRWASPSPLHLLQTDPRIADAPGVCTPAPQAGEGEPCGGFLPPDVPMPTCNNGLTCKVSPAAWFAWLIGNAAQLIGNAFPPSRLVYRPLHTRILRSQTVWWAAGKTAGRCWTSRRRAPVSVSHTLCALSPEPSHNCSVHVSKGFPPEHPGESTADQSRICVLCRPTPTSRTYPARACLSRRPPAARLPPRQRFDARKCSADALTSK